MRRSQLKDASGPSARWQVRSIARAAKCAIETLESRVLLSVNVTTYHYDQSETGANTNETVLTPSNVNVTTFGKVASLPVDGQLYAQPLVMTGVSVPGQGTQDLVFAATEYDSVYAFNAEGSSTTPVWHTSLLQAGETPISSSVTSLNINPWIGITGTPVIDPATNTLYCVGSFTTSSNTYQMRLYALDITTGAVKYGGPVILSATVNGTGAGSSGGKLTFNTLLELQRPALTLANGQIYMAFASHNDQGSYHGWVFAYNETTLTQTAVWCSTPNGSQGGMWMSGGGLAVDSSGDLYFTSGNGSFDANSGGKDYAMALMKLSPSLSVLDYFSPYNEASLSNADEDYGCGNAVLLPTQSGSAPNEAITLGKWGGVYLNNTDSGKMGEFVSTAPNKDLSETSTGLQQHDTFSYWNGNVYIGPDGGTLRDYSVGGGALGGAPATQSARSFGAGSSPTISSNGTSNGILWAVDNGTSPAIVFAYNPANLGQVYWASNQAANGRDTSGPGEKWTSAVVANGYVYVGGANSVTLYSNIPYSPPPPPPPPPPPVPPGALTGFNQFTLNKATGNPAGVPAISGQNATLTLTTTAGNEGSSAIYNTPVGYQNFTTQFTYTETGGNPPADGITFMLENDPRGVNAIGGLGGGLGYSGITPSFAAEFNVYQGSNIATGTNGTINIVHNAPNTGSVDLASGDPINVIISYNASTQTLNESLVDQVASDSYTTSYTGINLSSILGSGTAYMGFTGATGGANSLETITNFSYYVPGAPAITSVTPSSGPAAGGTSVTLAGSGFSDATAVSFGSTPASSFTVNSDGSITAVDPAGSGTVDVKVVTAVGTSATSTADQFTYVVPPVSVSSVIVNGNNAALAGVQRSMVDSIVYTFNQAVTLAATNAFAIGVHSGQTGTAPTLAWAAISPDTGGASTQWVVTFSGAGVTGNSIANGVYDITLDSTKVTSETNPTATVTPRATDTFYRLFGDINGDGRVNNADYAAFLSTNGLNTGQSGFNAAFDSNGDGRINNSDYAGFLTDNGLRYSGFTATL
jgi:hypothetical protein